MALALALAISSLIVFGPSLRTTTRDMFLVKDASLASLVMLLSSYSSYDAFAQHSLAAFHQGLQQAGYV